MIKRWRERDAWAQWHFGLVVWASPERSWGIRAWFGPWSWVVKRVPRGR